MGWSRTRTISQSTMYGRSTVAATKAQMPIKRGIEISGGGGISPTIHTSSQRNTAGRATRISYHRSRVRKKRSKKTGARRQPGGDGDVPLAAGKEQEDTADEKPGIVFDPGESFHGVAP
jgi:hypothetical protein